MAAAKQTAKNVLLEYSERKDVLNIAIPFVLNLGFYAVESLYDFHPYGFDSAANRRFPFNYMLSPPPRPIASGVIARSRSSGSGKLRSA